MSIVVNQFRTVTCIDLIKRAYRLIGVYSIGEAPSADEAIDGLNALNAMMGDCAKGFINNLNRMIISLSTQNEGYIFNLSFFGWNLLSIVN